MLGKPPLYTAAVHPLLELIAKEMKLAVGLMSGTSADGVDVALVQLRGSGYRTQITPLGLYHFAFPESLQEQILHADTLYPPQVAELDRELGEFFAHASLQAVEHHGLSMQEIDFIGSHGQTIYHHSGNERPATMQIGNADYIAELTQTIVVSDFRVRDIAAGGEGAPLTPYCDAIFFQATKKPLAVLNLGGIANITFLGKDTEQLLGFDVGPGNMLMDGLCSKFSSGAQHMDQDGKLAKQGKVLPELLSWLLDHPFLHKPAPKSTGRESFGLALINAIVERFPQAALMDLLATTLLFTAKAVELAIETYGCSFGQLRELLVAGGGAKNPCLMQCLEKTLQPLPVFTTQKYGLDPQAREAVAFAILANETLHAQPGNHPGATGARRKVPLGKISL